MSDAAKKSITGTKRSACYQYLVFLGNNSELVRQTLQRRPWWKTAIADEDAKGSVCVTLPSAIFGGPPRMDYGKHKIMAEESLLDNSFDFCWRPTLGMKLYSGDLATVHSIDVASAESASRQLMNHFPSVKCIASKTGILRSLQNYYGRLGIEVFDNVPTTFILKDISRKGLAEYSRFCSHFRLLGSQDFDAAHERMPAKHCRKNMWLVKPAYLNQGKGIKVYDELTQIKEHLMSVDREGLSVDGAAVSAGAEWVVQKYCEKPLLINGRKFDIRIWVVVDDKFNVYVYPDGYCRTSSEVFNTDLRRKPGPRGKDGHDAAQMVHLTNYCMQKHSKNLGAFEEGNTLSFEQLQSYIDGAYGKGYVDLRGAMLPRMNELILDSVLANRANLVEGGKGRRYFELFGYDFLIDCDFRSWLIEVNTNPYIDKQNPWHHRLLLRMMEDLATLCIDPFFPPPGSAPVEGGFVSMLPATEAAAGSVGGCTPSSSIVNLAANTPGFIPLPEDCFTKAFVSKLSWSPNVQASTAAEGESEDEVSTPEDNPEAEGDEGDEHGVDGNNILALSKKATASGGSPARAAVKPAAISASLQKSPYLPRTHSSSKPPSSNPSPVVSPVGSDAEDDNDKVGYRNPRLNGWQLLYSEDPRVDPLLIPHQKAMSNNCVNKAAVDMCREKGGLDRVTAADLFASGIKLDFALDTADDDMHDETKPFYGPFLCRYVHTRDARWLYPRGAPAAEDTEPFESPDAAFIAAQTKERDERFQKLRAANAERRTKLRASTDVKARPPRVKAKSHPEKEIDAGDTSSSEDVPRVSSPPQRPKAVARVPPSPMRAPLLQRSKSAPVEEEPKPAPKPRLPVPSVPVSSDAFAFVVSLKPNDRVVWAVTQLRHVLERCAGPVQIAEDLGTPGALPPIRLPSIITNSTGDDSIVSPPVPSATEAVIRTPQCQLSTVPELRKLTAAALKHMQTACEQEGEAASRALVEGALATVFPLLQACAVDEEIAMQAESEGKSEEKPATESLNIESPPSSELAALLPLRARESLVEAYKCILMAYKRDSRCRTASHVPPLPVLLRWASPKMFCPWVSMSSPTTASMNAAVPPAPESVAETEAAVALAPPPKFRGSQIHSLQSAWAAAESRAPITACMQQTVFRVFAHLLSTTRSTTGTDASTAEAAVLRSKLIDSGIIATAAAHAVTSGGDIRKAARDVLAYVSPQEIRKCQAQLEAALSSSAEMLSEPFHTSLHCRAGGLLAQFALNREISVKTSTPAIPSIPSSPSASALVRASKTNLSDSKDPSTASKPLKRVPSAPSANSDSEILPGEPRRYRGMSKVLPAEGQSKPPTSIAGYSSDVADAHKSRLLPPLSIRRRAVSVKPSRGEEHSLDRAATADFRAVSDTEPDALRGRRPFNPRRLPPVVQEGVESSRPAAPKKTREEFPMEDSVPVKGETDEERAARTALAMEEWRRRKAEEARVEKAKLDFEKAAIEAERIERERLRLEKVAYTKRKLAEARQRDAEREAARVRRLVQRAKEAQLESQMRSEVARMREASWVGLSSAPPRAGTGPVVPIGMALPPSEATNFTAISNSLAASLWTARSNLPSDE